MKDLKEFIELLEKDYRNECCCISLANFGKDVDIKEYDVVLNEDCKLIRKKDGTKFIKVKDTEIKITKNIEELEEEEKVIVTDLIEKGIFEQVNYSHL